MAKQTNFAGKRHTLTVEDQRKGGKRSGEVRRDLRDTREIVRRAMSMYLKNSDPAEINYLSEITDGANISAKEAMIYAQLNRAMNGDTMAFKALMELAAENGGQQQSDISELYKALDGDDE